MKLFNKKGRYNLLLILCCFGGISSFAQVFTLSGPTTIQPGNVWSNSYAVSNSNTTNYNIRSLNWYTNSTTATVTPYGSSCDVLCGVRETLCTLQVSVVIGYDYISGGSGQYYQTTLSMNVIVLPYIAAPDPNVYVGQTTTFHVQDNCGNSNCNYNWSVASNSGNLCAAPCNVAANSFVVTCPSSGYPSTWQVDCQVSCTGLSLMTLPTLSGSVKLGPMSPIAGPTSMGCGPLPVLTYPITYSIPAVIGANTYNWTVPSFMTITQGAGTNAITVDVTGSGTGTVSVQAIGNSPVVSDLIKLPVQVCCVPFVNLTSSNNVVSPNNDHRQAAYWVHTTNSINSGATGLYHAAHEVKMSAGFKAVQGSYFHGYIAGCNTGYYRLADTTAEQPDEPQTGSSIPNRTLVDQSFRTSVIPNPSNGQFTVLLDHNSEYPESILVVDVVGKAIYERSTFSTYEPVVDLKDAADGMYLLKISYKDNVITRRIVKSQ